MCKWARGRWFRWLVPSYTCYREVWSVTICGAYVNCLTEMITRPLEARPSRPRLNDPGAWCFHWIKRTRRINEIRSATMDVIQRHMLLSRQPTWRDGTRDVECSAEMYAVAAVEWLSQWRRAPAWPTSLSRVSILTRVIDIANLSVCLSVRLFVRNVPASDENGLTYRHSFFTVR